MRCSHSFIKIKFFLLVIKHAIIQNHPKPPNTSQDHPNQLKPTKNSQEKSKPTKITQKQSKTPKTNQKPAKTTHNQPKIPKTSQRHPPSNINSNKKHQQRCRIAPDRIKSCSLKYANDTPNCFPRVHV